MAANSEIAPEIARPSQSALCDDCHKVVRDILARKTTTSTDWKLIESEHATVTYFQKHLDGTLKCLRRSVASGCGLCRLIDEQLQRTGEPDVTSSYTIFLFIWGEKPANHEFKVAIGDAERFIKHIKEWKQPGSLTFYQKRGLRTRQGVFNTDFTSETGRQFSLPLLPTQDLKSVEAFQQAEQWLANCEEHHEQCARPLAKLPKRVLDLGETEDLSSISLYVTKGRIARYATLSYCWGPSGDILKTTEANLEQHCRNIDFEWLPNTLKDAVLVAKRLGFRYLWIDSLCIIQGHSLDWAEQSVGLTDIYGCSTLNISATTAEHNDEGFLHKLTDRLVPLGHYRYLDTGIGDEMVFAGHPLDVLDLEGMQISSRGWVVPERLVSPATLHYTCEGMLWECADGIVLGHDQSYTKPKWKAEWKSVMENHIPGYDVMSKEASIASAHSVPYEGWNTWICSYSQRNFSHCTDRLQAMASIAKAFAMKFNVTYVEGLWKENILSGLLWRRHDRQQNLTRFVEYVAPSWSWASVHGRLDYRNVHIFSGRSGPKLEIEDFDIEEEHGGTYGRVRQGRIVANGFIQFVTIDRRNHGITRPHAHQACRTIRGFVNNINVYCMLDAWSETDSPLFDCWCVRIGSFDSNDRQADTFLLLRRIKEEGCEFSRIGFAETDPWEDMKSPTPHSGEFACGKPSKLVLV
jgi:hypothetical protein